jgi:hypothetical protein
MGDDMTALPEATEELVVYEPPATPTLFGTTDPAAVVEAATRAAKPLAEVVRAQKLAVKIGPSEHVRVEGWTLLGSMLGVFPYCVWSRKITGDDEGWEARVEARTRDGSLVGAAEAECLRSEKTWKTRDDYALRSMAQTRATSKALRQPLGFVMQLAGFNPTPAEEMPTPTSKPLGPKTEKDKAMRTRIRELAVEADAKRGDTLTADEVEAVFKANWDTTLEKATAEQLEVVGKELSQWLKVQPLTKFELVPF